jgi:hypothetical protein
MRNYCIISLSNGRNKTNLKLILALKLINVETNTLHYIKLEINLPTYQNELLRSLVMH